MPNNNYTQKKLKLYFCGALIFHEIKYFYIVYKCNKFDI